jgi:hypothetical protein
VFILTTIINFISVGVLFGGYGFLVLLLWYLGAIPFTLLTIYNIDCLTNGNCNIWAWINSILLSISSITFTIIVIIAGTITDNVSNLIKNNTKEEKKENFIY